MFSGGIGSWAAAKRVTERHGVSDMVLLFTDTRIEDADTYRFLDEAADNVGAPLVKIADGRTPWELFSDEGFLGNTRVDLCSRVLKRELADRWLKERYAPDEVVVYVGIDWTEMHRYERLAPRKLPYVYEAPLCEPPYLTKDHLHDWAEREGLEQQRLYRMGMPHANCGGGCVKMGQGGFARLYFADPCRFGEWEDNEERLREQLGNVAILRDRRGGKTKPLPLRALRARLDDTGGQIDLLDIGGCGCFVDVD